MTMRLPGEIPPDWRRRGALAGVVLVLMLTSFAFGRFSKQAEVIKGRDVVHEVKVYEAAANSEDTAARASSSESTAKVVTHDKSIEETHAPDGTVRIVRRDVETIGDAHEVAKTSESEHSTAESRIHNLEDIRRLHRYEMRKPPELAQWRVGLLLGLTTSSSRVKVPADLAPPATAFAAIVPMSAGASLERRIVGPVWAGVTVTTDKSAFVGLSMEF